MGMFDDLVPQQGAPPAPPARGMFDDLIPQETKAAPPIENAKPSIGQMFVNDVAKIPTGLYEAAKSALTLPHDVMTGEATVPQSANMPGGEQTGDIGRTANFAQMFSPLSRAGLPTKVTPPTNEMLRAAKNAGYDRALQAPIEVKPDALSIVRQKISTDLENDGINDVTAPVTFNLLKKLDAPSGAVGVTPQNLRAIQRSLNLVKNGSADSTERLAAGSVANQFNNFLENMHEYPQVLSKGTPQDALDFSQNVQWANANNTALKTAEMFDQRGATAEFKANAAHSGMNLENNLRSQAAQILSKPALQRGMSPDTIQALKDFNAGSRSENTLRLLGNVFGGGGGLGMLAAGSVGHMLGLPFEVGPGLGLLMKGIANRRAAQGFSAVGDTVRANSPLAQAGATSSRPISPLFLRAPMLGLTGATAPVAPPVPFFGINAATL